MGKVVFEVDADTGKAIKGFLKVVDTQRKMERGFSKGIQKGRRFDKAMSNITGTIKNMAGGFMGARGITMGVRKFIEEIDQAGKRIVQFESEMTGLISLGTNVENIKGMKEEVLNLSAAFGISSRSISDALFNLQSGSAGLSKTIQDEILKNTLELVKVTGTEMPTALNALLKTYRIYGSETMTVNDIQNKLFKTAELGYLTFQDLATLYPDLAAAAKTFGFSMDEVGGAVITATQKLGRTQKTLTGLRNVFLRMAQAQKMGVDMSGDFAENLKALETIDPGLLMKVFGVRTVSAIGALVSSSKELKENIQAVADATGDIAAEKLDKRLKDLNYVFAEFIKRQEQVRRNEYLRGAGQKPSFAQRNMTEWKLREQKWRRTMPVGAKWLGTAAAFVNYALRTPGMLPSAQQEAQTELERQGLYKQAEQEKKLYPGKMNVVPKFLAPEFNWSTNSMAGRNKEPLETITLQELDKDSLKKGIKRIASNTSRNATLAHGEKPEVK